MTIFIIKIIMINSEKFTFGGKFYEIEFWVTFHHLLILMEFLKPHFIFYKTAVILRFRRHVLALVLPSGKAGAKTLPP